MIPVWARRYMGLEWDPERFDCWELARRVLLENYGVELPSYREEYRSISDEHAVAWSIALHSIEWRRVPYEAAQAGDLVLFAIYGLPQHLGVVLDPPVFMHVERGANVSLERWESLRWRPRLLGIYRHPALEGAPA